MRPFLASLFVLSAIVLVVAFRVRPPDPKDANAPLHEFSAARARDVAARVLSDEVPHPIGTPEHARVRDRVVAEFRAIGLLPEIQRAFHCGAWWGICAFADNIVVELAGIDAEHPVLVSAHYDSAPVSPGASDDGAGVAAILEIARIFRAEPVPRRSILFVVFDGEEAGLIGSQAFVRDHPRARDIAHAVNLEARGSSGPSAMFETGPGNEALIRLYAHAVSRPLTSSAFYEVYERMPNDTDFSVFRAHGITGFNLAFIGGVSRYHTPNDTLANLDLGSLQHHGDNALELVRALVESNDGVLAPEEDAVFFDVLSLATFHWPASFAFPMSLLALFLLVIVARLERNPVATVRGVLRGLAAVAGAGILATLAASVIVLIAYASGSLPSPWIAHPLPLAVASVAAGFTAAIVVAERARPRTTPTELWIATWLACAALAVAASVAIPGFSYVFFVPSATASLLGLASRGGAWRRRLALIAPPMIAVLLWSSMCFVTYDAIGVVAMPIVAVLMAILVVALLPLALDSPDTRPRTLIPFGGATLVISAAALVAFPTTSQKVGTRASLEFHQDGNTGRARWLVTTFPDALPRPIDALYAFAPAALPFPWSMSFELARAAEADRVSDLRPPVLEIATSSSTEVGWTVRARLASSRNATTIDLVVPDRVDVRSLFANGARFAIDSATVRGDMKPHRFVGVPAEGLELEIDIRGTEPVTVDIMDRSPDLPAHARALLDARPSTAVPSQAGDGTLVSARQTLEPPRAP